MCFAAPRYFWKQNWRLKPCYGHSRQPRPWPGACLMTQGPTNHQTGRFVIMGFWRITAVWDGANKIVGSHYSHWCCVGACFACFAKHKYKHHVVIQQRLSVFASMLASWRHKFYRAGAVSAAQTQPMEEETVLEIKFPHQWFILYAVGSCLYWGTSCLLRAKLNFWIYLFPTFISKYGENAAPKSLLKAHLRSRQTPWKLGSHRDFQMPATAPNDHGDNLAPQA